MNSQSPACIHRVLEDNIQEYTLTEVSRRAIDELFDLSEQQLRESALKDLTVLSGAVLINSAVGMQPLNHGLLRLRMMAERFPQSRKRVVALILPSSPLLRTVSLLMRPIAPMRIYMPHEREAALAWLREVVGVTVPR